MATDWLAADPLDPAVIRALLATSGLGRVLEVHRSLASTGDRVRDLARAGSAAPGLAVLAEEQTRGRGRAGRAWVSPPGAGVWMTVLVAPGPVAPGLVTLGAGVAVRRAVGRVAGVTATLRWPNDLEVGGEKLCGILGESVPGGAPSAVALGIGLNVHGAPAPEVIGRPAAALDLAAGRPIARNLLVAALLSELERVLGDLAAGRSAPVLAAWREGCSHLGMRVEVVGGEEVQRGIAVDIDATGALLLEVAGGRVVPVVAGSLAVLGPETLDLDLDLDRSRPAAP